MSRLKKLGRNIMQTIENSQKARVLREFLDMSDKQLADIGISRAALKQGVKAYPWREVITEDTGEAQPEAAVLGFDKAAKPVFHYNSQQPKLAA